MEVEVSNKADTFGVVEKQHIAIAGSTGFVGTQLISLLLESTNCTISALSRQGRLSQINQSHPESSRVSGISVDFFSLHQAEKALEGCNVAYYLIHSMIPSNRLSQGNFEDFDFILADNFVRAAKKSGVTQIVYVSGIVDESTPQLSQHLRSRLEVEKILGSKGIPLTTFRCSLVVGAEGSSFLILKKIVSRLPIMALPTWCNTQCQPVALQDLVTVLVRCLHFPELKNKCIDFGSPEVFSYRQLIELTAKVIQLKRMFITIPGIPVGLSKLWIMLITGASKNLVYPLVESLRHSMVIRPKHKLSKDFFNDYTSIQNAIEIAIVPQIPKQNIKAHNQRILTSRLPLTVKEEKLVKSVQRLRLPPDTNALKIARYYFNWLSRFFNGAINVKTFENKCYFYLMFLKTPVLELTFSPNRSTPDRQLFYITGGLLAQYHARARLEFRESPLGNFVFAAIHDFKPSLPWWIYRLTQAPAHSFVMWSFGRFLKRIEARHIERNSAAKTKGQLS